MLRPDYPIATDRLLLRPFTEADIERLYEIRSRPDVARYLRFEPMTRDDARGWFERNGDQTALGDDSDVLTLAVERRADGRMIGDVVLFWRSRENRLGEVGYVFDPAAGGHGFATEAAAEMLRIGFDELKLHRIEGRLDDRNGASARLLERLGMRREGCLTQNEYVKGEWCDEAVYAILEDEWRARR